MALSRPSTNICLDSFPHYTCEFDVFHLYNLLSWPALLPLGQPGYIQSLGAVGPFL